MRRKCDLGPVLISADPILRLEIIYKLRVPHHFVPELANYVADPNGQKRAGGGGQQRRKALPSGAVVSWRTQGGNKSPCSPMEQEPWGHTNGCHPCVTMSAK